VEGWSLQLQQQKLGIINLKMQRFIVASSAFILDLKNLPSGKRVLTLSAYPVEIAGEGSAEYTKSLNYS
jgi:hypothetical protein